MNVTTIEQPAKLAAAAQALAEREEQLRVAEAAVVAAEQAVAAAHRLDVEAVAAAREAGEIKDPPPRHEEQAVRELAAAEREAEIAQARANQIRAGYERIAEEQRPLWRERIEREWRKLEKAQRRRVEESPC